MSVVNGLGDIAPPLFVFKRKLLPYRQIIFDGQVAVETFDAILPRGAGVEIRDENGGVDGRTFYTWAETFVEHIGDLIFGSLKVLLVFNGYRAHMT